MPDSSEIDMRFSSRLSVGVLVALLTLSAGRGPALADRPDLPAEVAAEDKIGLETKIGQMILVGFLGNAPGSAGFKRVREQLRSGEVGGVLYLGRNLKNRTTVCRMNAALSSVAPTGLPPLIAIDQEGGTVQRLKRHHGFPQTASAKHMARRKSPAEAALVYGVLARGLADWGFTLNLGPVADVDINPRNPIIGRLNRSFSGDPGRVADYAAAFVDAHRDQGVLTALKHFPGHGSSRRDSHRGAVDISRTWSEKELKPFQRLIDEDRADLIMTAHVINRALQEDRTRVPVSLSQRALRDVLRGDLGYSGVIISDDLQMNAIRRSFSLEQAVLRAVAASTDILLFANDKRPDPEIPAKVANILLKAVMENPALREQIDAAYGRIRTLKARLAVQDPERCSLSAGQ
ncbi:glycoside hydrolase family 3 protein [Roseibium sediminicola]|uniref:beta-N-acetylhexosaminidase n=1 Tax=Roseibium sediminicola TaxID=2933272 RepID=A0ABT0GU48_9HYPH|nr:glycoside hydrolase family 3 N-terminal domain-containing protein [Roseibium sp. CAU 1639]MCK7612959.1 glycoside hydrolase family 3 protein [Roseibium sp. CAU 1639]